MTDEEYVRAHWVDPWKCWGLKARHSKNDWQRAAEFTRERLEQIRQLEEDISTVRHEFKKASVCGVGMGPMTGKVLTWSRILARLESALDDLRKGMRA